MQGPGWLRHHTRGSRAGAAILTIAAAALLGPAPAGAFVSSTVANGQLVARSDNAADIIKISCGFDLTVKVNGLNPTHGVAPCASIKRVQVFGSEGPDTINLSRVGPRNGFTNRLLRRPRRVQAFGGASTDRISGSRLPDLLSGGGGHDLIRGRAGADLIKGGKGSDRLLGGRGADRLIGGPGRDRLNGGAGDDVLID
jgi:RTX calcium-binding nonapeptide repeat (4 copies)